jgi:hypothetical protein
MVYVIKVKEEMEIKFPEEIKKICIYKKRDAFMDTRVRHQAQEEAAEATRILFNHFCSCLGDDDSDNDDSDNDDYGDAVVYEEHIAGIFAGILNSYIMADSHKNTRGYTDRLFEQFCEDNLFCFSM